MSHLEMERHILKKREKCEKSTKFNIHKQIYFFYERPSDFKLKLHVLRSLRKVSRTLAWSGPFNAAISVSPVSIQLRILIFKKRGKCEVVY